MIKANYLQKFWILCVITLIVSLTAAGLPNRVQAEEGDSGGETQPDLDVAAEAYILMDAVSGRILLTEKADKPLPPASMTKMMTEYLVLEAINNGELSWEQEETVSANAFSMGGSQVYLAEGEVRTVKELFTAMSVYSANDATVALAEAVAGNETAFVKKMNEKAKEMGLTDTHFLNSTGLPQSDLTDPPDIDGKHLMTAFDTAVLARNLLQDYPEVTDFTTITTKTFREEPKLFIMENWNWMLEGMAHAYEGVDGLKTGWTDDAGYCFAGSAIQGEMRFITVVMGTSSRNQRFVETKKLLDYGFNQFNLQSFVEEQDAVSGNETVEVANGKETEVEAVAADDIQMAIIKDEVDQYEAQVTFKKELKAPIKAGDPVGEVTYHYDGKPIPNLKPVALIAVNDVGEAGWFQLFFRSIKDFVGSIFSGIAERITEMFS